MVLTIDGVPHPTTRILVGDSRLVGDENNLSTSSDGLATKSNELPIYVLFGFMFHKATSQFTTNASTTTPTER